MSNYELTTLLEKVLNKGYQMKNGEIAFHCPFCNHHKKKLQVNLETQKWHCWVCNKGGYKIGILLRKINAPKEIIKDALKYLDEYVSYSKDKEEVTQYEVSLPKHYKPLWVKTNDPLYRNALVYLKRRGIGVIEILRYSIGYCNGGRYSNRIIVPSYDTDGKLNYFLARDIFPDSKFKYKNPPMSKDTICFELFINWDEPIILCEGAFDAIAIKRNAIPLYGKTILPKLNKRIYENKVKNIYIALDRDALSDSLKMMESFMNNGINIYLLEFKDKDPSELGFLPSLELVRNANKADFMSLIKYKLR